MIRQIVTAALAGLLFLSAAAWCRDGGEASAWQRAQAAIGSGEWTVAIEAYREHLATEPDDAWSWYALGVLLHSQSKFAASQEAFEKALEAKIPVPSVAQYNLAASLARLGRLEPAMEQLEEALAGGFVSGEQLLEDPDFQALPGPERQRLARVADESHRPCLNKPGYDAFDFWVGQWEVRIPSGFLAARDEVTRSEDGCVLTQWWEGTLGNTGRSYTYYDAANERWMQTWVGSGGAVGTMTGGRQGGAMVLSGPALAVPGATARTTWTPQPDGTVRVETERSEDGGATWTSTGLLTYHRAAGDGS